MMSTFESNFDPVTWLKQFKDASLKGDGFRELRAEIFQGTINYVRSGMYKIGENFIPIPNQALTEGTVLYECPPHLVSISTPNQTKFSVIGADCIETGELLSKAGYKPCILNMASEQNPGGGVIHGAGAQEENIFRRSNMFISLYQFVDYCFHYGIDRSTYSYPLDSRTGGIYSSGITVFRGSENTGYCLLETPFKLDFVTVAAFNRPETEMIDGEQKLVSSVIEPTKEKIRTILRIAGTFNNDCLVLGAFGCGAFHNPPGHVASLFKSVFQEDEFINIFKLVVFSILENHNSFHEHNPEGNLIPFLKVFQ